MNRNNRLYTIDEDREQVCTAAGVLLQFWALSEGAGDILDSAERLLARRVVDNVMEVWHHTADSVLTPPDLPGGQPASEMSDAQLMRVIDILEQACVAIGAAQVFEIIYRPDHAAVH